MTLEGDIEAVPRMFLGPDDAPEGLCVLHQDGRRVAILKPSGRNVALGGSLTGGAAIQPASLRKVVERAPQVSE